MTPLMRSSEYFAAVDRSAIKKSLCALQSVAYLETNFLGPEQFSTVEDLFLEISSYKPRVFAKFGLQSDVSTFFFAQL